MNFILNSRSISTEPIILFILGFSRQQQHFYLDVNLNLRHTHVSNSSQNPFLFGFILDFSHILTSALISARSRSTNASSQLHLNCIICSFNSSLLISATLRPMNFILNSRSISTEPIILFILSFSQQQQHFYLDVNLNLRHTHVSNSSQNPFLFGFILDFSHISTSGSESQNPNFIFSNSEFLSVLHPPSRA
ncbi:hypothetical protein C5167_002000 [Papaver somniferum]|uniref:Uncharacterized protein n=1 Tax=Papaver somniferum TaxID=3469 RepID=A0A4Y7KYD6_PAPSO|nr:hypothetical protein C5167_002000 [Papaver somniferum]